MHSSRHDSSVLMVSVRRPRDGFDLAVRSRKRQCNKCASVIDGHRSREHAATKVRMSRAGMHRRDDCSG